MSKIEMGKEYRTRDGREVRIYAVDAGGIYPIHGATLESGRWLPRWWTEQGQHWADIDLFEVKPTITRVVWLVWFDGPTPLAYFYKPDLRADAEECGAVAITGPHTITFTPGEGL